MSDSLPSTLFSDIAASTISDYHDLCLTTSDWPARPRFSESDALIWRWIETNHLNNCSLWEQEDQARRRDVADSCIAENKRAIDRHNQARNDAIERMDEIILGRLSDVAAKPGAWFSSETAGSIIDRLSIISLKIFHMHIQSARQDIAATIRDEAADKHARLLIQRRDLQFCLDQLLFSAASGKAYYRIYRQFKMYNDPRMNPYLSGLKQ